MLCLSLTHNGFPLRPLNIQSQTAQSPTHRVSPNSHAYFSGRHVEPSSVTGVQRRGKGSVQRDRVIASTPGKARVAGNHENGSSVSGSFLESKESVAWSFHRCGRSHWRGGTSSKADGCDHKGDEGVHTTDRDCVLKPSQKPSHGWTLEALGTLVNGCVLIGCPPLLSSTPPKPPAASRGPW